MRAAAKVLQFALVLTLLSACSFGSRGHAGYADFSRISGHEAEKVMDLSLGPLLLGIARMATEDDPETQAILQDLRGVRIRSYEWRQDTPALAARVDRIAAELGQQGWSPVVQINDKEERLHLLIKTRDERMQGMALVIMEQQELVLLNLMGSFDPDRTGEMVAGLGMDLPGVDRASQAVASP